LRAKRRHQKRDEEVERLRRKIEWLRAAHERAMARQRAYYQGLLDEGARSLGG
jgi:hypothetical protein